MRDYHLKKRAEGGLLHTLVLFALARCRLNALWAMLRHMTRFASSHRSRRRLDPAGPPASRGRHSR